MGKGDGPLVGTTRAFLLIAGSGIELPVRFRSVDDGWGKDVEVALTCDGEIDDDGVARFQFSGDIECGLESEVANRTLEPLGSSLGKSFGGEGDLRNFELEVIAAAEAAEETGALFTGADLDL